jgi:hypothetical protein
MVFEINYRIIKKLNIILVKPKSLAQIEDIKNILYMCN